MLIVSNKKVSEIINSSHVQIGRFEWASQALAKKVSELFPNNTMKQGIKKLKKIETIHSIHLDSFIENAPVNIWVFMLAQ